VSPPGARARGALALGALAALLGACGEPAPRITAAPGEPLPGLTPEERHRFQQGEALFRREFTPEEGLGPLFNDNSCFSCHDTPTSGGAGVDPVTLASRWVPEEERCELPSPEGGLVVQQRVTPALQQALLEAGVHRQAVPHWATATVEMIGPPLYGLGLIDAIPDQELMLRAASGDRGNHRVRGRPSATPEGRPGRFGRKATHADLRAFVAGALLGEMGITTPVHPRGLPVVAGASSEGVGQVDDPELGEGELALLTDYVRFLAAPPPLVPEDPADRARVARGEALFSDVGCAGCHVPVMTTGPNEVAALDRVPVPLYSDLLLHDLGPAMAGVCGPDAGPSEWRTAILMGLRFRSELLHDGRAGRLEQAIALHGGDASQVRDAFQALNPADREALLAFLRTL
jgi:CxxC motif-containing protein (DUF1111 family)